MAAIKREWTEMAAFYSNPGKSKRERWAVGEFLRRLKLEFDQSELILYEQDSKVDVQFRNAGFQVKELPDLDLRRSKEIQDTPRRVQAASSLRETLGPAFVNDVPPVVKALDLALEHAEE